MQSLWPFPPSPQIRETVRARIQSEAFEAISTFWAKAELPVRASKHAIAKLEAVFGERKGVQKQKHRATPGHKIKEEAFIERLDERFDIAKQMPSL